MGESAGMRMMIGSVVASGSVRVRKARGEMALMERADTSLTDLRYRDACRYHSRAGNRTRTGKCVDLRKRLQKVAKELGNVLGLHGRPGCVSYRA